MNALLRQLIIQLTTVVSFCIFSFIFAFIIVFLRFYYPTVFTNATANHQSFPRIALGERIKLEGWNEPNIYANANKINHRSNKFGFHYQSRERKAHTDDVYGFMLGPQTTDWEMSAEEQREQYTNRQTSMENGFKLESLVSSAGPTVVPCYPPTEADESLYLVRPLIKLQSMNFAELCSGRPTNYAFYKRMLDPDVLNKLRDLIPAIKDFTGKTTYNLPKGGTRVGKLVCFRRNAIYLMDALILLKHHRFQSKVANSGKFPIYIDMHAFWKLQKTWNSLFTCSLQKFLSLIAQLFSRIPMFY